MKEPVTVPEAGKKGVGTGMLTKTGNFVSVINTQYIDTGKIVGAGGAPLVVVHDEGLNLTTVTVIPEPGSLMLFGLAGLGLLMRRRRIAN